MNRKEFIKWSTLAGLGIMVHPLSELASPNLPSSNVTYFNSKDTTYQTLRLGFNKRINKFPAMIALCQNTAGVQEAVWLANQMNMPISIKSGGHCMEGFSGNNNGMQIVLSPLNKITWVNPYSIKVGPGCTLQKIYEELIPKNKILPGGSCAGVGIGGLALGGGYGLMSRLFGLTCDSLEAVKMVDGNGKVITSAKNTELLWACKGGGNGNFGIVTEMTFKVHNRPKYMSSFRFRSFNISTERGKTILKTWMEESKKLPKACFSTCLFNRDTAYILLTNVSKTTPSVQHFIQEMKLVSDKMTTNWEQPLGNALKNYYGQKLPLLFKNASAGLYNSYQDLEPIIDSILQLVFATKGMIFQFNTLGGAIHDAKFEQQSSFPHRQYDFFTELQTYWETNAEGIVCLQKFEEVQQLIAKHGVTAQYRNYPDINFKDFAQSYYGKNVPRLQAIKNQYDPNNLIRHEQSIIS